MEKLKNLLTLLPGINFALIFISAYLVKSLILSVSFADAAIIAVLSAVYGFSLYLKSKKPDPVRINNKIAEELENVKSQVSALKLEKGVGLKNTKRYF